MASPPTRGTRPRSTGRRCERWVRARFTACPGRRSGPCSASRAASTPGRLPMSSLLALGRAGEAAAAAFLTSLGWQVIGSGFLARRGEIDLVCRRGDRMVVVEVKTRSSDAFGTPADAVGPRKRRALSAAAAEYRALAG